MRPRDGGLDQNQHRHRSEIARSDDDSDATADETFARYYACVHVDAVASSPGCRVMHEDQQPSCSQHVETSQQMVPIGRGLPGRRFPLRPSSIRAAPARPLLVAWPTRCTRETSEYY